MEENRMNPKEGGGARRPRPVRTLTEQTPSQPQPGAQAPQQTWAQEHRTQPAAARTPSASVRPQPARPRRTEKSKRRGRVGRVIRRTLLFLLVLLVSALCVLFSAVATVAHGPSETIRDLLVLSAMQASATKWVPGLF